MDACRAAAKENAALPHVGDVVSSVLAGQGPNITNEVSETIGSGEQWWEVRVEPLARKQGGAVIAHVDITAKKRAELHAARNLETISHMNRVAAVSELAASLAHELNQPLAAIGANAESAVIQLRHPPEDLTELRETMTDIISDNMRAGEVIRRMRELLKKRDRRTEPVDLNELAQKVVPLVRNEALIRHIEIRLVLAPSLPLVTSDRVQLQQVILNLVTNAMDAMADIPAESRAITIRTVQHDNVAILEVEDTGRGIPEESLEGVFDSFYSTKSNGLGVGLSISRSIVEADRGRIWAGNRAGGGAIFRFALPVSSAEQAQTAS